MDQISFSKNLTMSYIPCMQGILQTLIWKSDAVMKLLFDITVLLFTHFRILKLYVKNF
jgi:hypothetical protein